MKMAKDSTAESKVGSVQKTRRFYLVSKYCSKVRIYMYANVDFPSIVVIVGSDSVNNTTSPFFLE